MVILSRGKCGLSSCTSRYLVAMSAADLLVIFTQAVLDRINYHYFPLNFLDITTVCRVVIVLKRASVECSVWFTVTFTFDRYVAICCDNFRTKYCTGKTAATVLATAGILLCLKDVPLYFAYEPGERYDGVEWFCITKRSYYADPLWVGFNWFDTILTPLIPFAVILLLNALTVRHILEASRVRKGLRGERSAENRSDPEMESRRRSVILLFTISGSFIILWLTYVSDFIYYNIRGTSQNDSEYIFQQVGYLLQNFSCCTNTLIYAVTQCKFREQLKTAVKYPATAMTKTMKAGILQSRCCVFLSLS
ncbi:probable G-protein coupled receptor 139 [Hemitrygon akajei]|uniref:probable G-protein coupled receptor 139 n=1 Tax=Hemitrygon akajei TaxID=2704970 RepID=UPI003BF97515